MKHLTIALMSLMLMTAAKCQGLKECPKTDQEFTTFARATFANLNRAEGLKNFKKLVTTTKIANCKRPDFEEEPLIQMFGHKRPRGWGQGIEAGAWDRYFEEMVRHLFTLNVDLHAVDNHPARLKAIHAACNGDSIDFLKLLVELGADPATTSITVSGRRRTTIDACNGSNFREGVRFLLETGRVPTEDICDAYWHYTNKRIVKVYEEFGWNDESCPIDG